MSEVAQQPEQPVEDDQTNLAEVQHRNPVDSEGGEQGGDTNSEQAKSESGGSQH